MNYADCLRYEPWDGGKGDDPYRVLSDRLLRTRKPHECVICLVRITPNLYVRARTELQLGCRGVVRTFYFCPTCCIAMAMAVTDERDAGQAIEGRTRIGMDRAEARRSIAPRATDQ